MTESFSYPSTIFGFFKVYFPIFINLIVYDIWFIVGMTFSGLPPRLTEERYFIAPNLINKSSIDRYCSKLLAES